MPHEHLVHIKPNNHYKQWSPLTCPQHPLCYKSHWLSVLQRAFLKGARWSRAVKEILVIHKRTTTKREDQKILWRTKTMSHCDHMWSHAHAHDLVTVWQCDRTARLFIKERTPTSVLLYSTYPLWQGPCLQPDLSIKIRDDLFGQHAYFQNSLKIKFKSNWTKYAIVTSYHDIP